MLAKFYQNIVLKKPNLILFLLLICLCFFGYYSKNFKLDASSETLLIEGDPDLKYLNEINDRYGAKEFLVLTYTPKKNMIDETSINNLLKLKKQIQEDWKENGSWGLHIHTPEAATPKDGPSAGGAITLAIISQLTNTAVKNTVGMTGEIDFCPFSPFIRSCAQRRGIWPK